MLNLLHLWETDIPLALMSHTHPSLFHYFKQQFAQVTNPPIDSLREEVVVDTTVYLGSHGNLLVDQPQNCRVIDKTIVGKHQASIEGGLTNNLKWKFIDLGSLSLIHWVVMLLTTPLGSTPMAVHIYTVVPYRHTMTSQRCGQARATRMPHCLNLNMEALLHCLHAG